MLSFNFHKFYDIYSLKIITNFVVPHLKYILNVSLKEKLKTVYGTEYSHYLCSYLSGTSIKHKL